MCNNFLDSKLLIESPESVWNFRTFANFSLISMNIAATIQILNFLNLDRKAFCFYLLKKNEISLQPGGVNL